MTKLFSIDKIVPLLLVVACLTIYSQGLNWHSIEYRDDEIFYYKSTNEMLESGDLLTPTYFGENRFQKPILYYWLVIISFKIFGQTWFAARFVSAVFASLVVLMTWVISREFFDRRTSLLAALICSTTPLVFRHAKNAVPDITLTFWIVLSVWAAWRMQKSETMRCPEQFIFFSGCGLGFMIKGLTALVFPFGVLAAGAVVTQKTQRLKFINWPAGVLIFLGITLPWFLYMFAEHGQDYAQYMLVQETQNRIVHGTKGPLIGRIFLTFGKNFIFYLEALFTYFAPWCILIPPAFIYAVQKSRRDSKDQKGLVWIVIWFCLVLFTFCMVFSVMSHYLLALAVPSAILVAYFIRSVSRFVLACRFIKAYFCLLIVFGVMGLIFLHVFLTEGSAGWSLLYLAVLCGGVYVSVRGATAMPSAVIFALFMLYVFSQSNLIVRSGVSAHSTLQRVENVIHKNITDEGEISVASHDLHEKELQVYFDRKISKDAHSYEVLNARMIEGRVNSPKEVYCLILKKDYDVYKDRFDGHDFDVILRESIFRKRLALDADFVRALMVLDRLKIQKYLMEDVLLLYKNADS